MSNTKTATYGNVVITTRQVASDEITVGMEIKTMGSMPRKVVKVVNDKFGPVKAVFDNGSHVWLGCTTWAVVV